MSTRRIYEAMKKFTDTRAAARDKYLETMRPLADARGSKYYTDAEAAAAKLRADTVDAAARECRAVLNDEFKAMQERNHKRQMTPPTEEQLRILQLLQMREHVTAEELDTAANAMQGNGAALEVVQDIAHKHEILRNYRQEADVFGIAQADEAIRELAAGCRRLLESPAQRGALLAQQMHQRMHGGTYNEDDLPQVPLFESESQFESFMGYGDRLKNAT